MYVCVCHALNDKQVTKALENGARTPASVFRHFGCQVQCGKCVPTMRQMAADHGSGCCGGCATPAQLEPANADAYAYGVAAE